MFPKLRRVVIGLTTFVILSPKTDAQTYLELNSWLLQWPAVAVAPSGDSSRLFIGENYSGRIRILDTNTHAVLEPPVLDIDDMPATLSAEQGLLGMAFDPNFATNGFFYVSYTGSDNSVVLRRYQMAGNPLSSNVADANSGQLILSIPKPSGQHNGGWIGFGPDGYLYLTVGDGGHAYDSGPGHDPSTGNAQDITDNFLGKILRLNVHGDDFPTDANRNYAIPPGNPFVGKTGDDEIWAYGLRNPWRASFDRQTGDMWIGDVGQNDREEVDVIPAGSGGLNFGWRLREGSIATPGGGVGGPAPPGAIEPIYDYSHSDPNPDFAGVAVIGGYVYHGPVAAFQGHYIFGDFYANLWQLDPDAIDPRASVTNIKSKLLPDAGVLTLLSAFGEDTDGNLYVMKLFGSADPGLVFRVATHSMDAMWKGNSANGVAGDGSTWGDTNNWTRGGVVDAAFVAEDNVIFESGSSQPIIHLGANRTVAAATFAAPYSLQDQTLVVLSGNITVEGGVAATISSGLAAETASQSLRKLGSGTLLVNGNAGQMVVKEGTLGGIGHLDHLTVRAGGNVDPGPTLPQLTTGILTVANSFSMRQDALLSIEIGGTENGGLGAPEFDQLAVGGPAALAGTLSVDFIDLGNGMFSPQNGDSFVIISAGNLSGTFDKYDLPSLQTGLVWKPIFSATAFSLAVVPRLPGDYDGDFVVDAADYVVWRATFGQTGTALAADGSGPLGVPDGLVDHYDFDYWRIHFGNVAAAANSTTVPEPTLMSFAIIFLTSFATRIRCRKTVVKPFI